MSKKEFVECLREIWFYHFGINESISFPKELSAIKEGIKYLLRRFYHIKVEGEITKFILDYEKFYEEYVPVGFEIEIEIDKGITYINLNLWKILERTWDLDKALDGFLAIGILFKRVLTEYSGIYKKILQDENKCMDKLYREYKEKEFEQKLEGLLWNF